MNTETSKALERLKTEINLKNLFEREARESDFQASEAIYPLFEPFLKLLQVQVIKDRYELAVQAWVDERPTELVPVQVEGSTKSIIKISFHWEPLEDTDKYREAKFSPLQERVVLATLVMFGESIGFGVEMDRS